MTESLDDWVNESNPARTVDGFVDAPNLKELGFDGSKSKAVNTRDKNFTKGIDRARIATMGRQAKEALKVDKLEAVADRGYYSGEEIKACDNAGIKVTLPKPMTSGAKSEGRFGKQDFVYLPSEDIYRHPAGEELVYHMTSEQDGKMIRRY